MTDYTTVVPWGVMNDDTWSAWRWFKCTGVRELGTATGAHFIGFIPPHLQSQLPFSTIYNSQAKCWKCDTIIWLLVEYIYNYLHNGLILYSLCAVKPLKSVYDNIKRVERASWRVWAERVGIYISYLQIKSIVKLLPADGVDIQLENKRDLFSTHGSCCPGGTLSGCCILLPLTPTPK